MLYLLIGVSGDRFFAFGSLREVGDEVLGTVCLIVVVVLRFIVDVSFVLVMLIVDGVGGKSDISLPGRGVVCGGVRWGLKSLCVN